MEQISDRTIFSLFEVTRSIQKTISERYTSGYWIKAEMNKLNYYSHSGHCYPELVEKADGKTIAQIKSILWKDDYLRINHHFLDILKEPLKEGIKILFLARISFDPVHGLSLRILDIDPAYTLGDLEREKQETIRRMRSEGIFNSNKMLQLAVIPKRIAVISVETSKGYADFLEVLQTNEGNYHFFHMLFPSLLQGEKAVDSIIQQLKKISRVKGHFDVVAIIRGGGGDVGLSCYNSYTLAREIALFPLPVITGIGHATNETVVEMISFTNAITPTKIAEFLVQQLDAFSIRVEKAREKISERAVRMIRESQVQWVSAIKLFRAATSAVVQDNHHTINAQAGSVAQHAAFMFKKERGALHASKQKLAKEAFAVTGSAHHRLILIAGNLKKNLFRYIANTTETIANTEKNVLNMSPENVLKRGYSITQKAGRSISSVHDVEEGQILTTIMSDGKLNSVVKTIFKPGIDE